MNLSIASNLKWLRKERKLTQDALAGFLGVSFQSISKWECGDGYPDITILPAIANFFNVTLDELMGMNEIRHEEYLKKIHRQWDENNINGMNFENIILMKESLKSYPNDYLLMAQLVTSLEKHEVPPVERLQNRIEAIELSQRIVDYCPDVEIKNAFLFNIAHSYWKNNDTNKAIERAQQLPTIYKTQENALVMFLEDKDKINIGQQAIIALTISLFHQISFMTDTDHYSPDEKIEILWKCCKVADILLENDDVPILQHNKASALMKMADIALKQTKNDIAIEFLQLAVDQALKSITLPQNPPQPSLLVNQIDFKLIHTSNFQNLQLYRLFSDEQYDSIRSDTRFKHICSILAEYL